MLMFLQAFDLGGGQLLTQAFQPRFRRVSGAGRSGHGLPQEYPELRGCESNGVGLLFAVWLVVARGPWFW